MAHEITYMGTKKQLAPDIASVINVAKPGIVLDVFAGMCSVGQELVNQRPVWTNDVQSFAAEVAKCLFTTNAFPLNPMAASNAVYDNFLANSEALSKRFKEDLECEQRALASSGAALERHAKKLAQWHLSSALAKEYELLRTQSKSEPYRLFTLAYSGSYFGLRQCIEIDSIKFGLDEAVRKRLISSEQRRWLVVALARALQRTSTTTGHFAQFLSPSGGYLQRFITSRAKSVWETWLSAIDGLEYSGSAQWRAKNRVFNENSLRLLPRLARQKRRPAVIYADPPYTDDQYSRFYHLLDTLVKYDYPSIQSKGRYRAERFQTPFSQASKAESAFDELAQRCASLESDMVVSYPANGLLFKIGADPRQILKRHYRLVDVPFRIKHRHSTLGASKGAAQADVVEILYWARK